MTNHEAIQFLHNMIGEEHGRSIGKEGFYRELCAYHVDALKTAIKALSQQTEDAISRQAAVNIASGFCHPANIADELAKLPSVNPQEPKAGKYEHHIDHTDCIWYGSDGGCPVTCSQYRDGWNDAMDYIFKNGKGYQPYRHDG